ncbi:MAG: vanadium-dependent haloperoxidase [Candidatus Sericytochromatia bacterium]|nr:vanadium-dependent haloperoxidase [Candidatus Sericytochromatia bacterium]
MKTKPFSLLLILLALSACSSNSLSPATTPTASPTVLLSPSASPATDKLTRLTKGPANLPLRDDLLLWSSQLQKLVQLTGLSPPAAARLYAYAGIAMHLALNPETRLQDKLIGLKALPEAPAKIDPRLYLHATLNTLLPEVILATSRQRQLLQEIDLAQRKALDFQTAEAKQALESGQKLGQHLAQWAREDGYLRTRSLTYTPPPRSQNPAFWAPTAPSQKALEPYWGSLRPFVLPEAKTCHTPPKLSFSTAEDSSFLKEAREVLETGQTRTSEQTAIARWWADNPGETPTPPGHWLALTSQLLKERQIGAYQAAQVLAVLGLALSDAFVSCWSSKFEINLLRPVTYIQQYLDQPQWKPLLTTPPFPEYPSGHSVGSGAAAEVLEALLGPGQFTDQTHVLRGQKARSFASFRAAADEAGISRLYGGIHYRDAIEQGLAQGRCVGQAVMNRLE